MRRIRALGASSWSHFRRPSDPRHVAFLAIFFGYQLTFAAVALLSILCAAGWFSCTRLLTPMSSCQHEMPLHDVRVCVRATLAPIDSGANAPLLYSTRVLFCFSSWRTARNSLKNVKQNMEERHKGAGYGSDHGLLRCFFLFLLRFFPSGSNWL